MRKLEGKVRVALIGAGGISSVHVRGFLAHKDKIECVALCDISEANMKARSEQLGTQVPQYTDWRQMLREMDDRIDAVDICLPHHLHAPAILDAAAAGKHILCEKPMCLNLKEADRIAAAVKKAGVTYMSAHNQLFMPAVQEAKRLIDSGELGKVLWIRSQDCFRANKANFTGKWRSRRKLQGGGELIDTGYHPCYRLLHLAGAKPVSVRATMNRFYQEIEGEDTASVQLLFDNGIIGEILTSWAFPLPAGSHQIHVIGEKAQVYGSGNVLHFLPIGYAEPAKKNLPQTDTFVDEIGHFADCLLSGKRPIHSVEEGRAVLEIILKATQNAKGWERLAHNRA